MKIKTFIGALTFLVATSAQANVAVITSSIKRVQTVTKTVGVTTSNAFNGLSASVATIAARAATTGADKKLESLADAAEKIAAETQENDSLSHKLRVEALVKMVTVVALSTDSKIIDFVMGKPYTAITSPDAQGIEDPLNSTAIENFSKLLGSVSDDNSQEIDAKAFDEAVSKADYIAASNLSELEPCAALTNGSGNR